MQETYALKITENLHDLCSNTVETLPLMTLLLQRKVFSLQEFQKRVTDMDRDLYRAHMDLYIDITRKCDDTFHKLLECLHLSGNDRLKTLLSRFHWNSTQGNINPEKVCFEVPIPTRHFVGRESLLDEIHQYWKNNLEQKALPLLVITGEKGIGKTTLASKYVELFRREVKGHCLWINAESGDTTIGSFADLTTEIRTNGSDLQDSEIIKAVCNHFKSTECIFVFDGLSNYREENFQRFFKRCRTAADPLAIKPFIFLTSVNDNNVQEIFELQANHVRLTTLDHSEMVEYFGKAFSSADNIELIDNLSCTINGHPAIMVRVAAHIMDNCRLNCLLVDVIRRTLTEIQNGEFILLKEEDHS